MKVEWHPDRVIRAMGDEADRVAKLGANLVKGTARHLVPKDDYQLIDQIKVIESRYTDGGFLVYAQPPGTPSNEYYAAFVEYGHAFPGEGRAGLAKSLGVSEYAVRKGRIVKKSVAAKPFMRPALKRWEKFIQAMWRRQLL